MDIGHGLASFGNSLADAMQEYHKRHRAYEEQMKIAEALSNVGITENGQLTSLTKPDANGKEQKLQGVTPLLNSKAYEQFRTSKQGEWDKNTGALDILNRMAVGTAQRMIGEKIQNARDIPTDIGGVSVPLTPGQFASQYNEQQRIDIAKQPRGPSASLQYRKEQDAIKQQQKAQEALPEFQFQKKYQVLPKDILNQQIGYETQFENPNETDPAKKKVSAYIPTTPAFREREFQTNQDGVKQKGYAPDPEGEILNFKGQRIPFQEYTTLQNRAKFVYERAKAALQRGTPPEEVVKRLEAMGFDPAGVQ